MFPNYPFNLTEDSVYKARKNLEGLFGFNIPSEHFVRQVMLACFLPTIQGNNESLKGLVDFLGGAESREIAKKEFLDVYNYSVHTSVESLVQDIMKVVSKPTFCTVPQKVGYYGSILEEGKPKEFDFSLDEVLILKADVPKPVIESEEPDFMTPPKTHSMSSWDNSPMVESESEDVLEDIPGVSREVLDASRFTDESGEVPEFDFDDFGFD